MFGWHGESISVAVAVIEADGTRIPLTYNHAATLLDFCAKTNALGGDVFEMKGIPGDVIEDLLSRCLILPAKKGYALTSRGKAVCQVLIDNAKEMEIFHSPPEPKSKVKPHALDDREGTLELGVIRNVKEVREFQTDYVDFDVVVLGGSRDTNRYNLMQAKIIMASAKVADVKHLDGKHCTALIERGRIKFQKITYI